MAIVDEDVDRVRERCDIVEIITTKTQLKRSGARFVGLCPFHGEKTPSFSVNAAQGLYHCFGCGKSGDVFTFVQESEHLDFASAVEFLARKYGIELHYTQRGEDEGRRRRNKLVGAVEKAVDWYHDLLLNSPDAGEVRRYLRSRGLGGDVVRRYRIGWAPTDERNWALLSRQLRLSDDDWKDSGLGNINSRGRQYDFFRGRIMFPILDERGDAVGFGGRVMPGNEGSKYVNTRDGTPIYSKSRILYGLNWAKEFIVRESVVVICEGYTDVIGFGIAGVQTAVATCGTALTDEHVQLLRRFTNRFVLAFDADAAGQNAAARVYEWERKHDLSVAVADLPNGVDPGDLARDDPERLRAAVSGARPFLQFRVDRVLGAADLGSAEGRARAAGAAIDMIREHPNDLVRDQYVMAVADRCRFDADRLRAQLQNGAAPSTAAPGDGQVRGVLVRPERRPAAPARPSMDTAEDEALRLLLQSPDEMRQWPWSALLFASPTRRAAYELLATSRDLHDALAAADDEVADLLRRSAVEPAASDAEQVASDLARYAASRELDELRRDAEGAQSIDEVRNYANAISWLRLTTVGLDDVDTRGATAMELLEWLAGSEPAAEGGGDVVAEASGDDRRGAPGESAEEGEPELRASDPW
jgi:DNA primase